MKALLFSVLGLFIAMPAMAATPKKPVTITYQCWELDRTGRRDEPVPNGLRMTVVSIGANVVEEGKPFPVSIEVVQPGKGKLFSARIQGAQEDVMFRFGGITKDGKILGSIYLDELNETSLRIHLNGGRRISADFDCK